MGFFDSLKKFFGGGGAATPVEVSPPNTEPAIALFPRNPEMEEAIARGSGDAWQVYADFLIEGGVSWGEVIAAALQGSPNEKRQGDAVRALLGD